MALGVRLPQGMPMHVEDFLVKARDRSKNVAGQRPFTRLLDFHRRVVSDIIDLLHRGPLIILVKKKKIDAKHGRGGISPCNLNNINRQPATYPGAPLAFDSTERSAFLNS